MSIRDKINELKKKNKEPTKTEVVIPVPKSEWEIDATPAEVVDNSKFFPREYDPELGINPRQFKYLWNRANALFGSEENLDEAYRNISDQLLEKTGKTKAQVLLAYNDYTIWCGHNPFAKIYSRFPGKSTNRVVKIRFGDGADGYLEFTETDTKKLETFNAMFAGKDISEAEMEVIEGIVKTYESEYVASKISVRERPYFTICEAIEGQRMRKGKELKIEPKLPDDEIPPYIPQKGNGR